MLPPAPAAKPPTISPREFPPAPAASPPASTPLPSPPTPTPNPPTISPRRLPPAPTPIPATITPPTVPPAPSPSPAAPIPMRSSPAPAPPTARVIPRISSAPVTGSPIAMPRTRPPTALSYGYQMVVFTPITSSTRRSRKLNRRPITRRESPKLIPASPTVRSRLWAWASPPGPTAAPRMRPVAATNATTELRSTDTMAGYCCPEFRGVVRGGSPTPTAGTPRRFSPAGNHTHANPYAELTRPCPSPFPAERFDSYLFICVSIATRQEYQA